MADKQNFGKDIDVPNTTIIDGVDVSGCSNLYGIEDCTCIDNGIEECCKDRNCYYKQLKRKEQECERLENENKRLVGELANNVFDSFDELDQLKTENERLKKEIRLYNCIEKWGTKECHCACRCLGNEFCDDVDKKIKQLKSENEELKKDQKN